MNTANKKQSSNHIASLNVSRWKFDTIIQILKERKQNIPSMAAQLLLAYSDADEQLLKSAYILAIGEDNGIRKQIDRIGYLRYELLNLMSLKGDQKLSEELAASITDALGRIPTTGKTFLVCEVMIRRMIHSILPDERAIAVKNLHGDTIQIRVGELSNHVYHLVKLGHISKEVDDRALIESLINNQLKLLDSLYYNINSLSRAAAVKLLKAAHWQPATLSEALKIYEDSMDLLTDLKI